MKFTSNARYNEPLENGTIFRGKAGRLEIVIHKIIGLEGWHVSCAQVQICDRKLNSETHVEAIKEGKEVVRKIVKAMQNDIENATEIEVSRY